MRDICRRGVKSAAVVFFAGCSAAALVEHNFSMEAFILFVIFMVLYQKWPVRCRNGVRCAACLLASCFTLFTFLGKYYMEWESLWYIVNNIGWKILVIMIGYWAIYCYLIGYLYQFLERGICDIGGNCQRGFNYWFCFMIIFLLWLPYIIVMWPGTIEWDALVQLGDYFGDWARSNHHPYLSSMIMGSCVNIGERLFQSDNIGLFIYTFMQCLVTISIMVYSLALINKWHVQRGIFITILLFYGLFTVYPSNAYYMNKDSMYSAFCLLLLLLYISFRECEAWSWKRLMGGVVTVLLIYSYRNNGVYLLLGSCTIWAVDFFVQHKRKAAMFFTVLLVETVILHIGYHGWFMPKYEIAEGRINEALSIPLQQTARYCLEHEEEITEEERVVLAKYFAVDNIEDYYDPEISDAVKGRFLAESGEELREYFALWWEMFIKHPTTYVKATLNNVYGYFYPAYGEYSNSVGNYRVVPYAPEGISVHFSQWNMRGSYILEEIARGLKETPFIGYLYSMGTYSWIILLITGLCIIRGKKSIMGVLLPIGISFLVCIASPVNGFLRYMLPIIYMLPVTVIYILKECDCNKGNDNGGTKLENVE
ncbi:MAG: DUF6020 family protein [Blautia sp.]|nr:DUF6020 family protein [Blautia sp.]